MLKAVEVLGMKMPNRDHTLQIRLFACATAVSAVTGMAALADEDRRPGLASLEVPTLVIHGTEDPLIPPQGGQETADAVPGAELVWIEGLGHEMPEPAWPLVLDPICGLVARVEAGD